MEVVIFNNLTTEDALKKIEEGAEKHADLYVDMDDAESRKYVKGEASFITGIRKSLEAARVAKSKQYRVKVEAEFKLIDDRLAAANLCYSTLIDEHTAKRKLILDAEKAEKEARLLTAQKESDHEFAIMMDEKLTRDIADEAVRVEKERLEYEAKVKDDAEAEALVKLEQAKQKVIDDAKRESEKAEQAIKDAALEVELAEKQAELAKWLTYVTEAYNDNDLFNAEVKRLADIETARLAEVKRQQDEQAKLKRETEAREANTEYKKCINNAIVDVLVERNISYKDAKMMVILAARGMLPNLTINY